MIKLFIMHWSFLRDNNSGEYHSHSTINSYKFDPRLSHKHDIIPIEYNKGSIQYNTIKDQSSIVHQKRNDASMI